MLKNYLLNPDFLLNVIYLVIFLFIVYKVLGGTLWENFQKKIAPWTQPTEKDFDQLIKRKMDMLRSNNGLYVPDSELHAVNLIKKSKDLATKQSISVPQQFKDIYADLNWGTGDEVKKIAKLFQREFSYSPNEANLRENLKVYIKEQSSIEIINHSTKEEIITYLYNRALLSYYLSDLDSQKHGLTNKIALRLNIPVELFTFSLQYSLFADENLSRHLNSLRFKPEIYWSKISSEDKTLCLELFKQRNAILMVKGVNSLNDIIRQNFMISDFIRPWPSISKNNELEDSLFILRSHHSYSLEDIKKNYKKLAQEKHPDKVLALKLPKEIELNAIKQFQIIQNAMSIVQKYKGK